jgi:hypothetical protein
MLTFQSFYLDLIDRILKLADPSDGIRASSPSMWPPPPLRPIRHVVVGYMSSSWDILPLVASGALGVFDRDRTGVAILDLSHSPLSRAHATVLFGQDVAHCCHHVLAGADASTVASAVNEKHISVLVDFDACVHDIGASVASLHAAPVQVRGWGSLWSVSAHVKSLGRVTSDRISSPPDYALDWSERLLIMPRTPPIPTRWIQPVQISDHKKTDKRLLQMRGGMGNEGGGGDEGGLRVIAYIGETVDISEESVGIWRETLGHALCNAPTNSSSSRAASSSRRASSTIIVMPDHMQAHLNVAAYFGQRNASVVPWPAHDRHALAAGAHAVIDAPSMSVSMGGVLGQVGVAVAGAGVPFVSVPGRTAPTRFAAGVLLALEDPAVAAASLARSPEEVPELTCRVRKDAISETSRDWAQRRLTAREGCGYMWERGLRILLDLAESETGEAWEDAVDAGAEGRRDGMEEEEEATARQGSSSTAAPELKVRMRRRRDYQVRESEGERVLIRNRTPRTGSRSWWHPHHVCMCVCVCR